MHEHEMKNQKNKNSKVDDDHEVVGLMNEKCIDDTAQGGKSGV